MPETARINSELEIVVRNGIVLDIELGVVCAWIYMASSGVNEAIMLRVLTKSDRRREADQIAVSIAKASKLSGRKPELTRAVFFPSGESSRRSVGQE
jgi:hypothetical protein